MSLAAGTAPEPREFFELRTYTLKTSKRGMLDEYLNLAFMPAVKRLGLGPVGVFVEDEEDRIDALRPVRQYVLVVHKNAETATSLSARLAVDVDYPTAAREYLGAKAADPVYQRIESSLLSAIGGMPKIELPDPGKPRLFNLRIYESHNERAAAKKVEMFEKGEIEIFKKVGLKPVFFASSVIGPAQPNLTYMLVFPDEVGREAAWDRFRVDPEWLKLKAIPEYADKEIVSKITNRILKPTSYSEI